jgi:hypothetical protein
MFDPIQEKFMQHEVRIQIMEQVAKDIKKLLWGIISIGITAVLLPIVLHRFGLA